VPAGGLQPTNPAEDRRLTSHSLFDGVTPCRSEDRPPSGLASPSPTSPLPPLSPRAKPAVEWHHLVRLRGALMRRLDRGARCGACGSLIARETSGRRRSHPPGPLGAPARSWLRGGRALPRFALQKSAARPAFGVRAERFTEKRGPAPKRRRDWRAGRRTPYSATDTEPLGFAPLGAPSPSSRGPEPGERLCHAGRRKGLLRSYR
jgi:hypothetical protein